MKPINNSTSLAVSWWRPAAWLRVDGPDAANFLQGQFTNDLRGLASGGRSAVYGLWLSVKGKVVADSFVVRGLGGSEFWIGSYFSGPAIIRERLESHIIADDVVVEDQTETWAAVTVFGGNASALLGEPFTEGRFAFRGRRGGEEAAEWVFPIADTATVRAQFGDLRELSREDLERLRITAAIPAIPADVGAGDLPNEAGLDADAISYTKGCYLGQEVMARLKSMGRLRRRLLRVAGTAPRSLAPLPGPLFVGERQVGELRSVVGDGAGGCIGLAMLSLLHLAPDSGLSFSPVEAPTLHLLDTP